MALVADPLAGAGAMAVCWSVFGVDSARGLGDPRVFLVGGIAAALLVMGYAQRTGVPRHDAVVWAAFAFALTFGACMAALIVAVLVILSDGGLGPA